MSESDIGSFENMREKIKTGFTISELLIALGVVAVLTAVLMPVIHGLIPDQNTLMAKRAFYTTETIIGNMINDSGCYPPSMSYDGFDDGNGYSKCNDWDSTKTESSSDKFAAMFLDRFDKKGDATKNDDKYTFDTKDGMRWELQSINFGSGGSGAVLVVDVDGEDNGPNCGQAATSGECALINGQARTKGFDRYTMTIRKNGSITISDSWAVNAVKVDKKLVGTDD